MESLVAPAAFDLIASVLSRDGTSMRLAKRKYGGSQFDWLLQKD